ncbi:hypothetical protein FQN60_008693 [Etheostoma spectabile]|uniref:Uncharacterized protein n=1 Tax=Etheostoma spectabile TaxID=54343 RepID=A0A5J5CMJ6_9PERO|nr:hypothetical protein FQN60_008693 [Etheostoma spectabile]
MQEADRVDALYGLQDLPSQTALPGQRDTRPQTVRAPGRARLGCQLAPHPRSSRLKARDAVLTASPSTSRPQTGTGIWALVENPMEAQEAHNCVYNEPSKHYLVREHDPQVKKAIHPIMHQDEVKSLERSEPSCAQVCQKRRKDTGTHGALGHYLPFSPIDCI